MRTLRLPPRGALPKTSADDPVDFYYGRFTGMLYRERLRLALRLLGDRRFSSLLEVGYGSGIFLPELSHRAERLVGVDVHGQDERVAQALRALGVAAELAPGSVADLPFEDGAFDAVVCLSVLEHLADVDPAFAELRRVLPPKGVAVVGFPARNRVTDSFFRHAGYEPRELHPSGHREILAAARRAQGFVLRRTARIPAAYVCCLLEAR